MTNTPRLLLFGAGFVLLALTVSAGGVMFLRFRANGFSARADPTAIEVFAARTARSLALPSKAKERINPVQKTKATLEEAMAHWADHCAVCHGNDGAGDVTMGKQMYPHAPDMRKERTQNLTDGELFYVIENGVRLTGMPAWGGSQVSEQASWKLVHFIRHLPNLTDEERAQMERLNPKGPEDIEREKEEEQFLNESQSTTTVKEKRE